MISNYLFVIKKDIEFEFFVDIKKSGMAYSYLGFGENHQKEFGKGGRF